MTGLSFELSGEQEQLRQMVRDFADREWPMSGTKIQKGRLRQQIADELAAASVTEAPRLAHPA